LVSTLPAFLVSWLVPLKQKGEESGT